MSSAILAQWVSFDMRLVQHHFAHAIIEFGFVQSTIMEPESESTYPVDIAFLSGSTSLQFFIYFTYIAGTASE